MSELSVGDGRGSTAVPACVPCCQKGDLISARGAVKAGRAAVFHWSLKQFKCCFSSRSSWKSDRAKQQIKDLNQEEESLPLMEDVLGNQEQAGSEAPSLEEPEKEAVPHESSETEKKAEEGAADTRQPCSPEERRHIQRERLNQILLNLLEKIPGKNGETLSCGYTTASLTGLVVCSSSARCRLH